MNDEITGGLQAIYNSNMREKTPLELERENRLLRKQIEKAIEYIENPRHEMSVLTYQNLLNILQNGSDDNE